MKITPLHDALGAEVSGLRIRSGLPESAFSEIRAAFEHHSLLVFRDQHVLSPLEQVDFSRRFGELELRADGKFLLPGHPEIVIVSNETRTGSPIGILESGQGWRSEQSYRKAPSAGTLVHVQVIPREGGDTLFAGQYAAYARLSAALRARIAPLAAEHVLERHEAGSPAPSAVADLAVHPVVRVHDVTRRPALFVNESHTRRIVGVPEEESAALLGDLFARSTDPDIVYRHLWRAGDLVLWDNRAVQYRVRDWPASLPRTLHRTTNRGTAPLPLLTADGGTAARMAG